jgi:chromosome segregation ATPase
LPPTYTTDPELLQRLDRLQALQAEMTEMARKFGATEAELRAAQTLLDAARRREDDLTRERDEWRAQAQQLVAVGGELQAVREERERLLGDSEAMRERIAGAERDRDQALERLNASIDRLDRVQTEHHTEITAVREQMAQAERDRDRLAAELETHLRMPWWRRLFA